MEVQVTPRLSRLPARYPNAIREYRLKAHLSQRKLASLVGRTRTSISAWECGQRLPTVPALFAVARNLSTLTEALYYGLYRQRPRQQESPRHVLR